MVQTNDRLWDVWWRPDSVKKYIIRFVKKYYFNKFFASLPLKYGFEISANDVTLEAGCGQAGSSAYIKKTKSCLTVGIDKSRNVAATAAKNCKYFVCGDIFFLPLKSKSVDVIFNQGVMEHFSDENISLMFQEFERVSRKKVVICVPASTSVFRFTYNPFKELDGRFMYKKEMIRLMEGSFTDVSVKYLAASGFLSLVAWGKSGKLLDD